jgi:hypothetical protein
MHQHLLGALLEQAWKLQGEGLPEAENAGIKALWRRRGLQAFDELNGE